MKLFYSNHYMLLHQDEDLPDMSYFGYDCFHFSEHAHRRSAITLWNNNGKRLANPPLLTIQGAMFIIIMVVS